MSNRRRRPQAQPEKGWVIPNGNQSQVPRKLLAFKAGQKIPAGAQYLTFALKNDVPHFFFLLPEPDKKQQNTIGFKLNK